MMAVYLARSCSKCGNYFGIVIADPKPWKIPTDQWSLLRMRIRDSLDADWKMSRYKGYPIDGVAAPAPEHRWYSRGIVFDRDQNQTTEIKRLESTARTFKTKRQAEKNGVELCKEWVDKQP